MTVEISQVSVSLEFLTEEQQLYQLQPVLSKNGLGFSPGGDLPSPRVWSEGPEAVWSALQIKTTVMDIELPLIKSELEAIDVRLLGAETTLFWNGEGTQAPPVTQDETGRRVASSASGCWAHLSAAGVRCLAEGGCTCSPRRSPTACLCHLHVGSSRDSSGTHSCPAGLPGGRGSWRSPTQGAQRRAEPVPVAPASGRGPEKQKEMCSQVPLPPFTPPPGRGALPDSPRPQGLLWGVPHPSRPPGLPPALCSALCCLSRLYFLNEKVDWPLL